MQKQRNHTGDWISKNQQEKPQTFQNFVDNCRNWDITEVIVLEMWDKPAYQLDNDNEVLFQRMFINNLESVTKIFFRGLKVIRVK